MRDRLLPRLSIAIAIVSLPTIAFAAGRIEGRLTLADGRGIPGVAVTASPAAVSTITGADGQFVLDGIADGEQTVVFTLDTFVDTTTVVVAGATVRVDRTVDWALHYTDTITVTAASRRRERLVETPASASVVPAEVIARDGGHGQLAKLLDAAPGVEVIQSGVFDFDLNMRGFNRALNRRVLVLIDGRDPGGVLLGAQEWASYAVPLDDVAQVEVINGPGSALYGANAFNGVVSIVTKDPRFHRGGRLMSTFGGRATAGASGMYADVLGDAWSYRVTGSAMRTDDFYVDRTQAGEYPGLPLESVAPHQGTAVGAGTVRFDRAVSRDGLWSMEGGTARISGNVFVSGTGRAQNDAIWRPWARTLFQRGGWQVSGYADGRRGNSVALTTGSDLFDHSVRIRGEALRRVDAMAARVRLIGGATAAYDHIDTADPSGVQTILDAPHTGHQVGAFGQADYDVTSRMKLVGALRVDQASTYPVQVSPKVSAAFTIATNQTIRAGFGRAFQPATYGELYPRVALAPPVSLAALEAALAPVLGGVPLHFDAIPVLALGNAALEPEKIDTVEAGYTGVVGRKWLFTADAYRSRMEHFISGLLPQVGTSLGRINPQYGPYRPPSTLGPFQQAVVLGALDSVLPAGLRAVMSNDPDGAPIFAVLSIANYGEVAGTGVDVSARYFATKHWTAEMAYSHFDFDVKQDLPDQPLTANTAPNRATVAISYAQAPVAVSLRYRWSDAFDWATGVFRGSVPTYAVLDLASTATVGRHYMARLHVANLLDHRHYELYGGDLLRRRAVVDLVYRW
jgi:outer membrane receptor for ferrienterochelin and colicins